MSRLAFRAQRRPSIRWARRKSASGRPPCECVESVRRTCFQPCTRMSGWWLAASAASATRLTNAIAPAKCSNARSRTIVEPSRRQSAPCRCCSICASLSSAIALPSIASRRGQKRDAAVDDARPTARCSYSLLMRIVSLVPHATELLFALGLGPEVVAVTHECDHPPEALRRRRVTRDVLPAGLSAAEIDAAVRERTLEGQAIYALDRGALEELAPELIVTQQ